MASPPPSRPQGLQCTRSMRVVTVKGDSACTTISAPRPPRYWPAPAESWRISYFSTSTGYLASSCSVGLLWVSPSLMQTRSEEHTSELQSHLNLVCRLL